jgi:cephalosporin-C deacetylase-like acetyl esterase
MTDENLSQPDSQTFNKFIQAQALALRSKDMPPANRREWDQHRPKLREAMLAAMGPFPDKACALEPQFQGFLKKDGYRIEKLIFQSRPDVWVTANAYVPEAKGKLPAVLVVHGHWPMARRDPVVQARCLGLVKLAFFVLAVDAFGSGERYPHPGSGTYHGALYGSTLWPVGQTLLGMQVYDNRRAVDYLLTRREVDGDRIGITGASGGGNQTMYAGALDERLKAVVPVCSVGTYQAYLQAACCVCEVLPGALRFTEEGDVLGLVAPRALLVINASQDAIQFSPGEAKKSVERARQIFKTYGADDHLDHRIFDSPHAYNQPMREAMYGWMTRWLKHEGEGQPIAEPAHELEKLEDLSCFPSGSAARPSPFLYPPTFAVKEARNLLERFTSRPPDHKEEWESTAVYIRGQLREKVFGGFPKASRPVGRFGQSSIVDRLPTTALELQPEPGLPMPVWLQTKPGIEGRQAVCILMHLDGKSQALKHPLAKTLVGQKWFVVAPELRATGDLRPAGDAIHEAADHNSAEHSLWIGRPLLGQWVFDVSCLVDWLAIQPGLDQRRITIAGLGPAGIVALCAAGVLEGKISAAAAIGTPVTYFTDQAYGSFMRMGLLAPGILRLADIPQLAALSAPRRLVITEGRTPQEKLVRLKELQTVYAFTRHIFRLYKNDDRFFLKEEVRMDDVVDALG